MGLNIKNWVIRNFLKTNPPFFKRFRPVAIETTDNVLINHPEYLVFREAGKGINLHPPLLNDQEYAKDYKSLLSRNSQPKFILKIEHGRVWGRDCAVVTPDGILLSDVSRQFGINNNYANHLLFNTPIIQRPESVSGTVAVISTAGSDVFYHWMLDILPRILILKENGLDKLVDYFILNATGLAFQQQTLAMLGLKEDQLLMPGKQKKQFHIVAEKLLVPSLPSMLNEINEMECRLLIKYLSPFSNKDFTGFEKIYISRKKAGTRFIVNEKELISILEPLGFVVIEMESLNISQQIKLFQTARIIIGAHGSAFTNIIFSSPGTRLVDILPDTNIVSCFYGIAAQMGIRYFGYIEEAVAINESKKNDAIKVDINKFSLFLDQNVLN